MVIYQLKIPMRPSLFVTKMATLKKKKKYTNKDTFLLQTFSAGKGILRRDEKAVGSRELSTGEVLTALLYLGE